MKRWILPLALAAGLAFAGTVNITDTYVFQALFKPWARTTAQLPTASAWTGYLAYDSTKGALTVSNGSAWVSSGLNALATGIVTWDFPALGGGGVNCAESRTVTITGAVTGDACLASADWGLDGGAVSVNTLVTTGPFCRTITNGAIVKMCAWAADAGTPGTVDLPDSGFFVRVIH